MSHGHGHGHAAGEGAAPESIAAGYELADTRARPLVIGTISVFVLLVVTAILMGVLLLIAGNAPTDLSNTLNPTEVARQLPPEPRLEQNPNVDGDRLLREATEQLESYGWVNERENLAHIPIERAMELLVERGIAPFGTGPAQGSGQ